MRVEVTLPGLGDDAGKEAAVSFFFPDVNDDINEGDDLVERLTDNATFIMPAPVSGKVVEIAVNEDDVVKVGELLAIIEAKS